MNPSSSDLCNNAVDTFSFAGFGPDEHFLGIAHEPAQSFGDVFALHGLWKDLGFDRALSRGLRSGRRQFDVEALVRAMVFNRLCAPDSKLGCLRWLDTVAMPAMPEGVTHQHLLRAMDALMDHADRVETELARQIRPLVDRDLAIVSTT